MKFWPLVILLFITSCTSYVRTLGTRMISPETSNGFGNGTLDVRLQSSKRDELDFANDQVNNKVKNIDSPYAASILGEAGIVKRFDAFVIPSAYLTPTLWGGKVQVLGHEYPEAKKGNFSASLMGAVGSRSESYSGSNNDLEDILNGNIEKLKVNTVHREAGLIIGYRWHDRLLHYANGIAFTEKVDGKVTTDNHTLQDAKFKYSQNGVIYSTGIIWYFGTSHWKVDLSHMDSKWSKTGMQSVNSINTALGFSW